MFKASQIKHTSQAHVKREEILKTTSTVNSEIENRVYPSFQQTTGTSNDQSQNSFQ